MSDRPRVWSRTGCMLFVGFAACTAPSPPDRIEDPTPAVGDAGSRSGQMEKKPYPAVPAGLDPNTLYAELERSAVGRPLEVHGHRGARAVFPENSLPAFAYALEIGADAIELDLGVTKDDRLVAVHDQHLSLPLCRGPDGAPPPPDLAIRSMTLAELKRYDCGAIANPKFPKQRPVPGTAIPTLDEVFELVAGSKHPNAARVRFNIETKSVPGLPHLSPPPETFAGLVVEAVKRYRMLDRVVVQSFDHRTLREVKRLAPEIPIAVLTSEGYVDHVAVARAVGAEIVSPQHLWITREAVESIHRDGRRVIPWTVNDAPSWDWLLELGVDGIITDDPEALLAHLASWRSPSP